MSGSITQSQLKEKLQAKLAADPTADIDVNRALLVSDLTINDLTASIAIDMPKKWQERFQTKAEFKRVKGATAEAEGETSEDSSQAATEDGGTTDNGGTTGSPTGGETPSTPTGGDGGSTSGDGGTTGEDDGGDDDDGLDKD